MNVRLGSWNMFGRTPESVTLNLGQCGEVNMWMTQYIQEIQRQLVAVYEFPANPKNGLPMGVPDGEYPMRIQGKTDNVRILNGKIECCNFPLDTSAEK